MRDHHHPPAGTLAGGFEGSEWSGPEMETFPMLKQVQKIGTSKGASRVCLWNRVMKECGFEIGTPIDISDDGGRITITPSDDPKARKVSRVMNHGNALPVIDLKQTRRLDVSTLGNPGDEVTVSFKAGRIVITAGGAS